MAQKKKHILILCPYPHGEAPSQRFRFEQYLDVLKEEYSITQKPFLSQSTWNVLYKSGHRPRKFFGVLGGFFRRFILLFVIGKYDLVFIHREASPIGFPFFEWLIAKVFRKKIIYDFDDAIWLNNTSNENKIVAFLKYHRKVKSICRWSSMVFCGNSFLAEFAKKYNSNVKLVPTSIDTSYHQEKGKPESSPITIGWTGTHSTEKYIKKLVPVLNKISHSFRFLLISNHNPELDVKGYEFIKWNKETEIEDLNKFDIGLMPLEDTLWAQGKCGFKGLQYMALGIATIMSPVGVNNEIIQNGQNGYLVGSSEEWIEKISSLIEDEVLRKKIGQEGRETVQKKYSTNALKSLYLECILEVLKKK